MTRWCNIITPGILLLLVLTACRPVTVAVTPNRRIDEIRAAGTLRIGTSITHPFEYRDAATNTLIGFDVDLMTEIFAGESIDLSWHEMAFADLLPQLRAGKVDVVIAAMYITPAREQVVDFSQPYLQTGLVMVVQADDTTIQTANDLEGKVVGVKEGSTGAWQADELRTIGGLDIQLRRYTDTLDSLDDLNAGQLDAVFNDRFNTLEYIKLHPGVRVQSEILVPAELGIAVRTGDKALLDFINLKLTSLQSDHTIKLLVDRWINPEKAHAAP